MSSILDWITLNSWAVALAAVAFACVGYGRGAKRVLTHAALVRIRRHMGLGPVIEIHPVAIHTR